MTDRRLVCLKMLTSCAIVAICVTYLLAFGFLVSKNDSPLVGDNNSHARRDNRGLVGCILLTLSLSAISLAAVWQEWIRWLWHARLNHGVLAVGLCWVAFTLDDQHTATLLIIMSFLHVLCSVGHHYLVKLIIIHKVANQLAHLILADSSRAGEIRIGMNGVFVARPPPPRS